MMGFARRWTQERREHIADTFTDKLCELRRQNAALRIDRDTFAGLLLESVVMLRLNGQKLLDANRRGLADNIEDELKHTVSE